MSDMRVYVDIAQRFFEDMRGRRSHSSKRECVRACVRRIQNLI